MRQHILIIRWRLHSLISPNLELFWSFDMIENNIRIPIYIYSSISIPLHKSKVSYKFDSIAIYFQYSNFIGYRRQQKFPDEFRIFHQLQYYSNIIFQSKSHFYFIFPTTKTAIKTSILTPYSLEYLHNFTSTITRSTAVPSKITQETVSNIKLLRQSPSTPFHQSQRPSRSKISIQSEKIEHAHVTVANGIVQLVEVSSFHEKGAQHFTTNQPTDLLPSSQLTLETL